MPVVVMVCAIVLSGCAPGATMSSGSRVKLYANVSDLARDSSLVVEVTVSQQDEHAETTSSSAHTTSLAKVDATFSPPGLSDRAKEDFSAAPTEVVVRQLTPGAGKLDSSGGPILREGGRYLLFLVPSGVPGEGADQFYITGGTAGLFAAEDDGKSYTWLGNEGDALPPRLTVEDLQ
ncbi:MAG: hypothetical protein RI885_1282 [Actinomycetota bacterium]|jgi:hypothetical protein